MGGLYEVLLCGLILYPAQEVVPADEVFHSLEDQVGVDRPRAVPDQQSEVRYVSRLARLDHQAAARARALTYQVVMHSRRGQQAGHRSVVRVNPPVRENEDRVALFDGLRRLAAQPVHRLFQPSPLLGVEQRGQGLGPDAAHVYAAYLLELGVGDERLLDRELAAVFRGLVEQVQLATYHGPRGRDKLLAYRVQRRVGDLRETLPEVVE